MAWQGRFRSEFDAERLADESTLADAAERIGTALGALARAWDAAVADQRRANLAAAATLALAYSTQ